MAVLLYSIVIVQLVCHAPRTGLNIYEIYQVSRCCSTDIHTRMRWNTCFKFHTITDSWHGLHTDTYLCNKEFGV